MRVILFAIFAVGLALVGVTTLFFDSGNPDISRPPSIPKRMDAATLQPTDGVISPPYSEQETALVSTLLYNPLDRYAVYQTSNTSNDSKQKTLLLTLAAERSRRDVQIQGRMIDYLFSQENYANALQAIDGLIRARPNLRKGLFEILVPLVQNPASRASLVATLAEAPPWRSGFLETLFLSKSKTGDISKTVADLRASKLPPTIIEVRSFVNRLIAEGRVDDAYMLWLSLLGEDQLSRAGNIYNSGFDLDITNTSFDWTIIPAKNVVARQIFGTSTQHGRVLEITFIDAQIAYQNLYQRTLLPPGKYVFSGDFSTDELRNEGGLVWRVYCVDKGFKMIGQTSEIRENNQWSHFELPFDIPLADCPSQVVRLEINAKAKLDMKISGRSWFDNIRIARAASDSTSN